MVIVICEKNNCFLILNNKGYKMSLITVRMHSKERTYGGRNMEYTKPVITKNELEVDAQGSARSCGSFKCTSSNFNCNNYDCTKGGHKFNCNSGW